MHASHACVAVHAPSKCRMAGVGHACRQYSRALLFTFYLRLRACRVVLLPHLIIMYATYIDTYCRPIIFMALTLSIVI